MLYDFVDRKLQVEYRVHTDPRAIYGYYYNYQVLKASLKTYQNIHFQEGEECRKYDLGPPYDRMFSPTAWRKVLVDDIEVTGESFYETERQNDMIHMSGNWDKIHVTFHAYSNGTFDLISVGHDEWKFFNFKDLTALDNEEVDTSDLGKLKPPEMECIYAGFVSEDYQKQLQHKLPFPMVKPSKRGNPRGKTAAPAAAPPAAQTQ
jgi:hypothetical protein